MRPIWPTLQLVTWRDDLDVMVRDAGWNPDQLAVYADELQRDGDPRGELIALDLQVRSSGETVERAERRREVLRSLLGERATDPTIRCRYGWVELELDDTSNVAVLAQLGPFAAYLRGVRIIAGATAIGATIDALSISARPWLGALSITQRGTGGQIVSKRSLEALAAATPHLDTFEVSGHRVLASLAHPTVRSLQVTGMDAVLSFTNTAALLPSVRELDLRFDSDVGADLGRRTDDEWDRYLPPTQFPALRRLDLERNHADDGAPSIDPFRFVRQAPIAPQLTHLRWPALRGPADVANAQAALDRMEKLVAVELPPGSELGALRVPRAEVHELRRSWRPLTRIMTTIVVDRLPVRVDFWAAARWLDEHYDDMAPEARAAWDYVWDVLLRQPRGSSRALFAEVVARALTACHGRVWSELHHRIQLSDHGPGVMLTLV